MQYLIRAVPEREHLHPHLAERLPDATWLIDRDRSGMVESLLSAFKAQGVEDAVHLEDDVILTRGFEAKVMVARMEAPGSIVQMFSQRKADLERGSRWDRGAGFVNTQAFLVPGWIAPRLVESLPLWDAPERKKHRVGDLSIAAFLASTYQRYWIHVPSLVQHRDTPSTLGHVSSRWHSPTFVDPWEDE